MKKIRKYLQEVAVELKKVTFPSKEETWEMTSLVITVSAGIAVFVSVMDWMFRGFVRWLVLG